MGYLEDQQGIMKRYLRESEHWKKHLDHCRNFIKSTFLLPEREEKMDSIAVLGSGWLLDVPLDHLSLCFRKIYLVDINHPSQIRKKTEAMEGVYLLEEDLSGGAIKQAWQFSKGQGPDSLEEFGQKLQLEKPLRDINPSAFISLNLLNQLDILLCDFLSRHASAEDKILNQFRKKIQTFHLQWITRNPGCLISDTREISLYRDGRRESKMLIHTPLPETKIKEKWTWEFDSRGTYHSGISVNMEVEAIAWP